MQGSFYKEIPGTPHGPNTCFAFKPLGAQRRAADHSCCSQLLQLVTCQTFSAKALALVLTHGADCLAVVTSARKASPRAKVFPHATPRFKTLTEFNEHRCAHPFLTESGLLWKVAEPTIFSSHG